MIGSVEINKNVQKKPVGLYRQILSLSSKVSLPGSWMEKSW